MDPETGTVVEQLKSDCNQLIDRILGLEKERKELDTEIATLKAQKAEKQRGWCQEDGQKRERPKNLTAEEGLQESLTVEKVRLPEDFPAEAVPSDAKSEQSETGDTKLQKDVPDNTETEQALSNRSIREQAAPDPVSKNKPLDSWQEQQLAKQVALLHHQEGNLIIVYEQSEVSRKIAIAGKMILLAAGAALLTAAVTMLLYFGSKGGFI